MKRKYYMRGLGVGILATSMLFLIAMTVMGYPMNDDDIRRKAAALGMVEASDTSKTLADAQKEKDASDDKENSDSSKETGKDDKKDDSKDSNTSDDNKKDSDTKSDDKEKNDSDEKKGTETTEKKGNTTVTTRTGDKGDKSDTAPASTKNDNGTVTFKIRSGEDSATVGANLYKAGLVDSGFDFNTYLEQNGYDTSIHPGTYTITTGSSYHQIASIITQ